ncbi:MAG: hypothetical protein HQM08_30205 [Candidatus Riflebacteria bacterium]|nr:hypothetical protein [Candidatus Riflebacteria bacterium]
MPRIPSEEIERLKEEVSVQRLAEARGVKLTKQGDNFIGLCPFHEDHNPSLVITPSKNLWNCLGACQTGGTVVDWVMKSEGVSFRHAVEILRNEDVTVSSGPIKVLKSQRSRGKLATPLDFSVEDRFKSQFLWDTAKTAAKKGYYYGKSVLQENVGLLVPVW